MVDIYYTRHCNTAHNLLKELKFLDKEHFESIENASLSNFGIIHGLQIASHFNFYKKIDPNVVCASYYVRTWQTAFLLYNEYFARGGTLYVLPYIHEHNDKLRPSHQDCVKEFDDYNIKKCMRDFIDFLAYLKKFMQKYYPSLCKKFTFQIPKIVLLNKFGKAISLQKAYNLNYYKKNIYLYNPNFRIFEKKILSTFEKYINRDLQRIAVITHGKVIKQDILGIKEKKSQNVKGNLVRSVHPEKGLEMNNCDTYMIRYKKSNKKYIRASIPMQYFPNSQRNLKYDYFIIPHFKLKTTNREKPIYQILIKRKMKLSVADKKMILGFYTSKKYMKSFDSYLALYKKWIQEKKNKKNK